MAEDAGAGGTGALAPRDSTPLRPPGDPAQLREEIDRTRRELGDTVAALAEKTDVKARAKEKVTEVKQNIRDKRTELTGKARESGADGSARSAAAHVGSTARRNPVATAALAAFAGGLVVGRFRKRG